MIQLNDILYTKNGRKSGNLTVIDIVEGSFIHGHATYYVECISDYGNKIKLYPEMQNIYKQYYKQHGKAAEGHKYYNYYENHPEDLI